MSRRILSIPLLCLIAIHAVFGGLRGATALCFGGHDHHEHGAVCLHEDHGGDVRDCDDSAAFSTAHASPDTCPHEQMIPGPVPVDLMADCCTCTDIEVDLRDLPATSRDAEDDAATPVLPAPIPVLLATLDVQASLGLLRGPPPQDADDPARLHGLQIVRSTRFNI